MPISRDMLLSELKELQRLTAFEQTIATVRRAQAASTPIAQELAANAAKSGERLALRIRRTRDPAGLALSGEADLAGRNALRTVIENIVADCGPGELTVDVSGLRFADGRVSARPVAAEDERET